VLVPLVALYLAPDTFTVMFPVAVPPAAGRAPISDNDQDTFEPPFTFLPVFPIVNVLSAPH
jgi:hypothetical protein